MMIMDTSDIDFILIDIVKEFTKPENQLILNSQKLGSSIFFSFADGVLRNDENNDDKIDSLVYCMQWIRDHESMFKNYGEKNGNE